MTDPAERTLSGPEDVPEAGSSPSTGKDEFDPEATQSEKSSAPPNPAAGAPPREASWPKIPGYEVLGELGRGGVGIVYKARHLRLGRLVALKMLLSGSFAGSAEVARFKAEAEAVAKLQHPSIVQIYEIGEVGDRPFFALELLDGGSLDSRIKTAPLPAREAAQIGETIARAIHVAHLHGIIHRDLKPGNILLTTPPERSRDAGQHPPHRSAILPQQIKITDFGLAKQLDSEVGNTRTGTVLGTPSYMAPEQAGGHNRQIGPATDVYALGALLYDVVTGRPPFKAATAMETIFQVLCEEPTPVRRLQSRVPRDLETIIHKCLEKSPRKRYASAEDLADDLRRFLSGEPIQARPMGMAERMWRWCKRNPVAASLLVTVTLGSALGMWYLSQLSQSLVRSTALESAAQQSEMFEAVNLFYSAEVLARAREAGVAASHDFMKSRKKLPVPATFTIELGKHITDNSRLGQEIRLYSNYPFLSRKNGGARDSFERDAIRNLQADPNEPYYRFETFQGRPSLRFATARIMKDQTCVDCHNTHPLSPKKDWRVGDMRGVLEIIRPLDKDVERTQEGLRGTFALVGGASAGLLLFCSAILVVGRWRRGANAAPSPSQSG